MSSDADIITALAHKLQAENTRLRAQNEALRAGQGTWPEHDDSPAGEQVPRVIIDAELRKAKAEALREARDNVRASSFWADGSDNYADRVRGWLSNYANATLMVNESNEKEADQ